MPLGTAKHELLWMMFNRQKILKMDSLWPHAESTTKRKLLKFYNWIVLKEGVKHIQSETL